MDDTDPTRDVVLVVDDSIETLQMLIDALDEAGYTVLVATSAAKALALVHEVAPSLILMDAMMPELDGFETTRRLKADLATADIPVVFMTGLAEPADIMRGFEAGGIDYVTKPIVLPTLLARLRAHLGTARQARATARVLDAAGRHLLAVDGEGRALWASPRATELLRRARPAPAGFDLSPAARGWLMQATRIIDADPQATPTWTDPELGVGFGLIGRGRAGEMLLRVLEARTEPDLDLLRARFGLTPREAEVLTWIARGKSNRDVGEILGMSPRTVNKHLEQIFPKLGVENRASAAALVAQVLG